VCRRKKEKPPTTDLSSSEAAKTKSTAKDSDEDHVICDENQRDAKSEEEVLLLNRFCHLIICRHVCRHGTWRTHIHTYIHTPWAIKKPKRATLFWTITSAFLDGFQHVVYQRKKE